MKFDRIFLPICLLLLGALSACVDVPEGPETVTNPDFRSLVRFFHAVPTGPSGNVSVDGASVGSIPYLAATAYADVASGARSVAFATTPAQNMSFFSEKQSTSVIYSNAGVVSYLNLSEGDVAKNNGRAGSAKIKFVNVTAGLAADMSFHDGDASTEPLATAEYAVGPDYTVVAPGTLSISAFAGDTVAVATLAPTAFEGGKVYTVVVSGDSGGVAQMTLLQDRQGDGPPTGKPAVNRASVPDRRDQ